MMKKRFLYTLAGACLTAALLAGCAGPNTPETIPDEHPVASLTDGSGGITSANAFARALVSGATVELGEGTILLEPDNGDLQTGNSFCRWESVYEGYELVISNVSNVTIRGAGQGKTTLECNPRAATVLTFENCENVTLEGFTAGHVPGAEPCEGDVINLTNSSNVTMKDLGLFGCGAMGVRAETGRAVSTSWPLPSRLTAVATAGLMPAMKHISAASRATIRRSIRRCSLLL